VALAEEGQTALVGAREDQDRNGNSTGAAYMFGPTGTEPTTITTPKMTNTAETTQGPTTITVRRTAPVGGTNGTIEGTEAKEGTDIEGPGFDFLNVLAALGATVYLLFRRTEEGQE